MPKLRTWCARGIMMKKRNGTNGVSMSEVEGEIREFVRRDFASVRQQPENDGEVVANNISSLLQRVSGSSVQEIDSLIGELQALHDRLQNEGERVQREIIQYANLSQAAMQSTKIIAESLTNWKAVPGVPSAGE